MPGVPFTRRATGGGTPRATFAKLPRYISFSHDNPVVRGEVAEWLKAAASKAVVLHWGILAMFLTLMPFGACGLALVMVGTVADLFASICWTMFNTRRCFSGWPWGNTLRWVTFAATNSMADAFGHAATHAPHPMHCAASMAQSALSFGTGVACASGKSVLHGDEPASGDDAVETTEAGPRRGP